MKTPAITGIQLHKKSKTLALNFGPQQFELNAEFLRVYSPSAEVRGHSPDQAILQTGKINVAINDLKAVGNYAVKLFFSDGHDSGIYTFEYLYKLGAEHKSYWHSYLQQLKQAGASRDPDTQVMRIGH